MIHKIRIDPQKLHSAREHVILTSARMEHFGFVMVAYMDVTHWEGIAHANDIILLTCGAIALCGELYRREI
jgi:hypothetical protein